MTDNFADGELLARMYPRLFHVTDAGNAAGIRRHGLRSIRALLELFEADETTRAETLATARPHNIELGHPVYGHASVRDQLPLSLHRLDEALIDMSVEQWLELLNSLVFFWPTLERVQRLLQTPAYVQGEHRVLVIDTGELVRRHRDRILLSAINAGATRPFAHSRGSNTFMPLDGFPLDERRRRRGRARAVAEVAVRDAVPDLDGLLVRVERWQGPQAAEVEWRRR